VQLYTEYLCVIPYCGGYFRENRHSERYTLLTDVNEIPPYFLPFSFDLDEVGNKKIFEQLRVLCKSVQCACRHKPIQDTSVRSRMRCLFCVKVGVKYLMYYSAQHLWFSEKLALGWPHFSYGPKLIYIYACTIKLHDSMRVKNTLIKRLCKGKGKAIPLQAWTGP
jgi:hypothetical protein